MGIFSFRAINELTKRVNGQQPQEINDPDEIDNDTNGGAEDNTNTSSDTSDNNIQDEPANDYTNNPDDDPNTEPSNDYTNDPDDDPDEDPANDYTNDPDDGDNEDPANDYSNDPDDGDNEDPANDYSNDPDDGGENTDDDIDDNDGEDDASSEHDPSEGGSSELKSVEGDLFKDITPEQMRLKNIELKQQYIEVFETIVKTIVKIDDVNKTEANSKPLMFITAKLEELKKLVAYYMKETYDTKSYIENSVMYQKYLVVLNTVTEMLDKLKIKE